MSTPLPVPVPPQGTPPPAAPVPNASSTSYPPLPPKATKLLVPQLGDLGDFWGSFDRANNEYDSDMMDSLKDNLNNLLIFAALFSAVNSALLALSVPMLSADSGEETNRLLRLLVQGVNNATLTPDDIGPPPFTASGDAIRINKLFTVSLTCSMLAALGALFGLQWITSYKRRPAAGFKKERWERQRRLRGVEWWQMEPLLGIVLPGLLQASLIVFILGLAAYLNALNPRIAFPNIVLSWIGAGALILTIVFTLLDPYCPFKTPFSEVPTFFLRQILSWIRWWAELSQEVGRRKEERLLLGRQPQTVLEGRSVERILETSADSEILLEVAKNIPLITDTQSLDAIYTRDAAVTHLFQLYKAQSSRLDPKGGAAVYSTAICHLLLAAQDSGNYARTNGLLGEHESLIILTSAQAHTSNPDSHISTVPSSIITVALAHLLTDQPDTAYLNFLERSILSNTSSDVVVAALAWILISARNFVADDARQRIAENLDFRDTPPGVGEGSRLFCYASEAYAQFFTPSAYITDGALKCVAAALENQPNQPIKAARPLLALILQGLVYILNDLRLDVKDLETLARVFNALARLLLDSELDTKATSAMCAILSHMRPLSNYRIAVDPAALKELETRAGVDDEVKRCIDAYKAP